MPPAMLNCINIIVIVIKIFLFKKLNELERSNLICKIYQTVVYRTRKSSRVFCKNFEKC